MRKAVAVMVIAAFMMMGLAACESARRAGKSFENAVSGSGERVTNELKKTKKKIED